MRITHIFHSGFSIELDGRTLLFDVAAPFGLAGDDSTLSERIAAAVAEAIPGCRAVVTVDRADPNPESLPKGESR